MRFDRRHAAAFAAVVLAVAVLGIEPSGDCGEYLLMARAFSAHATPEIRVDDAVWVAEHEPRLRGVVAAVEVGIPAGEKVVLGSIFRAPSGSYYSFHFWFYSLLCAPLLWLTAAIGAPAVVACALVNAAAVILAGASLQRVLSFSWLGKASPYLFLLSGTTYYLAWTGPEVLTASSVVVSVVAALSGNAGLAILAAGVAATQNPSTGALIPFACGAWLLLRARPRLALSPGATARLLDRRTALLATAGLCLAALPYAFFFATFGTPSLISVHATSTALIGWERAFSLFFDLNQGMLIGVPGVLLATPLALVMAVGLKKRPVPLAWGAATLAVTGMMIVPPLASHNWNSGAAVLMRYAYWSAMPLLALLLLVVGSLGKAGSLALVGFMAVAQGALLVVNGLWGGRAGYTEHSWAANLVLRRWPGAYNPVPEIFHERTVRKESPPLPGLVVEWPRRGKPKKLLVYSPGPARTKRLCRGRVVVSRNEVAVSGGARYLNPPLRCEGGRAAPE